MDQILKHAVEIGIQTIIPVFSEHSAFVLNLGKTEAKLNKWQSTLVESCKQSGCPILPKMSTPVSLNQFFSKYESDWKQDALGVVASLESGADLLFNGLKGAYRSKKRLFTQSDQREIFQKVSMKVLKA